MAFLAQVQQKRRFPSWHFPMINDRTRNRAIFEAIAAIDLSGKTVFEIGTGAGLIAMYFVKCGARHVYTCEMDDQLYEIADQIITKNSLSDQITLVHGSSRQYIQSDAFNFSPDVIYTETLDCGVVGEGYDQIAQDILRVAREDTVILPSEIRQYGFLVDSDEIAAQNRIMDGLPFDLSSINEFSTQYYFPIHYQLYKSRTLSPVHEMRRYDYLQPTPNDASSTMTAYRTGTCHGIVSYFQAQFGTSVVSNDVRDVGHWHQAFHPFPEPVHVTTGRTYHVILRNDGAISLLNG
ncbi:ribonucleotide-diphosphate reductase subunit beta (plasmid) [Methylobacterium indicum]|uniref:Ribonucleotide-diphosphate reductase subunit beta n=2 Tax=Methylobacterium indicum TaxID=1775910 RepID=A0A8H8X180_9HYPH|nr:ribonucleotide-diphosphate reductase subunit beta [Methylobacterium indicum]